MLHQEGLILLFRTNKGLSITAKTTNTSVVPIISPIKKVNTSLRFCDVVMDEPSTYKFTKKELNTAEIIVMRAKC